MNQQRIFPILFVHANPNDDGDTTWGSNWPFIGKLSARFVYKNTSGYEDIKVWGKVGTGYDEQKQSNRIVIEI